MNQGRIKCLLVDDEPEGLNLVRTYAQQTSELEIAGECRSGVEAFTFLQRSPVGLIFLDIEMPSLSGIELIRSLLHPPKVIFTTAHRDFAIEGFELNAVDYLLKPFSFERFLRAVQKVSSQTVHLSTQDKLPTERFLYLRSERKMVKVLIADILYIESQKDYVRIISGSQPPVVTKQPISHLETLLPDDAFVRIHRSFIVPISKIDSYTASEVNVGKYALPIGPSFRVAFAQSMDA